MCLEPAQSISTSEHATNMVHVQIRTSTSMNKIKPFTNIKLPVFHTFHAPDSLSNAPRENTIFLFSSYFSTQKMHMNCMWSGRKKMEREASMIHFSSIGVRFMQRKIHPSDGRPNMSFSTLQHGNSEGRLGFRHWKPQNDSSIHPFLVYMVQNIIFEFVSKWN